MYQLTRAIVVLALPLESRGILAGYKLLQATPQAPGEFSQNV